MPPASANVDEVNETDDKKEKNVAKIFLYLAMDSGNLLYYMYRVSIKQLIFKHLHHRPAWKGRQDNQVITSLSRN